MSELIHFNYMVLELVNTIYVASSRNRCAWKNPESIAETKMFLESGCRWMRYSTSWTHTRLWSVCRGPLVLKGFTFLLFTSHIY